jgi:hypothetical protein
MPKGWKRGRHLWDFVSWHKGPRGRAVFVRRCRLCGLEATNQSFSRARIPWCYAQETIRFDDPLNQAPPEPRRREWVQDESGMVLWIVDRGQQ